jgi:hypothetical protein
LFFCVGLDGRAGVFLPLAGERIGEMWKNPQYPEVGILQMRVGLVKSRRRFWDAEAARAAQVGRRRRAIPTLGGTSALPRGWGESTL